MKKVWIFVEGDTEGHFITHLIRKNFRETFLLEKDLSKFVDADIQHSTHHLIYCENCQSVDKIPHLINERYYLIERSGSTEIMIVCDIEKLKCNTGRKHAIESKLDKETGNIDIRYAFFNPMIESAYWECPDIIKKIIGIEYEIKFARKSNQPISIPGNIPSTQFGIKQCFKHYDLKYRETSFARKFFPMVDYGACKNGVLKRICNFLNDV